METTKDQMRKLELHKMTERILKEFLEDVDSRFTPYGQMSVKSYQRQVRERGDIVGIEKELIFRVWQKYFLRKDAFTVVLKFKSGRESYIGPCKEILVEYSRNFENVFPMLRDVPDKAARIAKLRKDLAVSFERLKNKLGNPRLEILNE